MDMSATAATRSAATHTAASHTSAPRAETDTAVTEALRGGPRHLAPRSDLVAERVPNLFTALPSVAIRREPHVQLGYDEATGEYHLSITPPLRTAGS